MKEITKRGEMAPTLAERYHLQLAVGWSTHEKLRYAQALLSHAVPSGDVAEVLDRALDALITQLERRKFGAGAGTALSSSRAPRTLRRRETGAPPPRVRDRYIPAHIRRAVWERDRGQCTFVSARGHRCGARRFLEFDHVDPVARGGTATVERMRLRCRAHNQYEAERAFGAGFMEEKRREARLARDVLAGLRSLGCRTEEARRAVEEAGRAAEHAQDLDGATLEQRMHAALRFLGLRSVQSRAPAETAAPGLAETAASGPAETAASGPAETAASGPPPATSSFPSFPPLGRGRC